MFNYGKRALSLAMSVALMLTAFTFGITAEAKSTAELRSEKEKIQQEINNAQSKINSLASEKNKTQEYLNALESKIGLLQDKIDSLEDSKAALQAEINAIESKITSIENEIIQTQAEIDAKQAEFDSTYALYCQRLRAMYVSGSASTLEVLLTCPDMSAMLTRAEMIRSVSKQDSAILDDLMTKMEEIESKKQELEIKRNELTDAKSDLESDRKELQDSINEIDSSKQELDKEAAECNEIIRKLAAQTNEYYELIETNRDELREVENQIRAAAIAASGGNGSISGSYGNGSGVLRYPTNNHSISAGYPNYSSGRYHGGVDFSVPSGSNIYAAAAGKVILVQHLNYSYGYYVVVDHGNGLSTLYAHNSSILVSVGQKVSAGQVIAKSGSTGNSTGPHCHFEVRVNGSRVNPFNYL